ncbi:MAG: sulfide/dihydroorotate dehydrogenase-like FAD/NAD-binding protein [Spirochaetes bacterium]|nr:sulfide/dihydroorotate dehydrogenase-like FAD/NAD-binding protein [Spirochaetota bacterium]
MYKITSKEEIAPDVFKYSIHAPLAVKNAKPGQFVIIIPKPSGERLPLTIYNAGKEDVTIIFQKVGHSTEILASMEVGESMEAVLGPLGRAAEIKKLGKVVCIGGGVGTAVLYPEIKALKEAGNTVYSIIGAREKSLLILEKEVSEYSDKVFITTDDGSYGEKGFVTDPLKKILEEEEVNEVIAIGPVIMMKVVSELTKKYNVHTVVSLNPVMVDGTGMCGGCRVEIDGKTKFACVDGPEFDGHQVNFTELMNRNRQYDEHRGEKCHAVGTGKN